MQPSSLVNQFRMRQMVADVGVIAGNKGDVGGFPPSLNVEQFGTSIWTRVNVRNGATIYGNVFGGGDAGAVKQNAEVVIGDE